MYNEATKNNTHSSIRPMPTANCFGHCLVQLCWHTNKNLGVAINPCKINSEISTGVIDWYHFGYCCFTFAISLSFATWTASFSNSVRLFGESLTNLDAVISETTSVCCISCTAWKPWPSLHIECNHLFIQCEYVCQISVNQHRHSMCMYSIIAGFVLSQHPCISPSARLMSTPVEVINSLWCKWIPHLRT